MNILFVCTGNISRSFLAEMLLKNDTNKLKLQNIAVASVGTSAYPGRPADPKMVDYLSETGVPIENHEARSITKQDVDWADLILVMERAHLMLIEDQWPKAKEKVNLLGKYISEDGIVDDVIDPFGRSPYHYRLAQSQISLAVRSLLEKLPSEMTGE
ncbi:low molecular weight protein arginine phosphatase [Thermodesulfobacteriota bacterium]